ncbi:Phosphate regulon transcriptional regulatory protein PhoB [Rosistilla carotiformis]|uniref:Phosphate regulon transcriptional regulatory protein PhoB n=1 Tax=Rosistilla carotiformis TaxID=2528017 RepID=A0A518JWD9_9BACT|nr:response regulator [Rosistilla carotiformis]QDV69855.1 Phosphate regulon transcriptional regulatory protein PhoB [Rosistilla carotiformis]
MPNTKILVVEDDLSVAEVLIYNLKKEGFEVSRALDGRDALTQARLKLPDLVILDVMLPSLNGLEVCRTLRAGEDTKNISILMLTAKSEDSDQIAGFSIGADDYVCKPFSVAVLLQRVKALLRRREQAAAIKNQDIVTYKSVSVDRRRYKATVGEEPLDLTRSEFRLLDTLIRQPGRVFDRAELIDAALGEDTMVLERTIDVHIRALRKKLGPYADVIETVRGVGYRFSEAMHEEV